jgi:cytochrome P450
MAGQAFPPGPQGTGIGGNFAEFRRDTLGFFQRAASDYGDFVSMRFGPIRAVFLNHPDFIERILVTDYRKFHKGDALRRNSMVFGNGLLTSEGDFWRRQRKLVQPAFHRERLAAYGAIMVDYAQRLMAGWHDGEVVDVYAAAMHLTLQIAARTLFGVEVGAQTSAISASMRTGQKCMERRLGSLPLLLLPEWAPAPTNVRLRRAMRTWEEVVYSAIRERRAQSAERDDLLAMLLKVQDEDGARMTDRQLRDEMLTLFLAGHETTALTLACALDLLSQHPEAEERMAAELDTALGGRPPTVADAPRLTFTTWVIQETLRLYPPAWGLARIACQACDVAGYTIPAGYNVIVSPWVMHRDPRYFDAPERFQPERWAGEFAQRLPKYAYFPFGGGPRVCIGASFALLETTLLLATLMQSFRFRPASPEPLRLLPAITLHPEYPLLMTLCRR